MDRFYTLMLVPEKNKSIKSLKIPAFAIKLAAVCIFGVLLFSAIILFDYMNLMQNVVDNKHISLENRQLREQLQIFQMKINTLTNDVERISTFEQKLRTITGLEREKLTKSYFETLQVIQEQNQNIIDDIPETKSKSPTKQETQNQSYSEEYLEQVPQKKIPKPSLEILPDVPAVPAQPAPTAPLELPKTTFNKIFDWIITTTNAQSSKPAQIQDIPNEPTTEYIEKDWTPPQAEEFRQKFLSTLKLDEYSQEQVFQEILRGHQQAFLNIFGISDNYRVTRLFSQLVQRSGKLSFDMARFDYQFEMVNGFSLKLEQKLHELDQFLLDRDSMLLSTPIRIPTNGWITSYFGPRINPYTGRLKMHEGIDVGAPHGASIYSPADGVVVFAGIKPGFGKHVQIDHGYGIETLYAHSERLHVKSGQQVKRGVLLANVGSTGHSTGPHLHYEVRINGVPVDPFYFIIE